MEQLQTIRDAQRKKYEQSDMGKSNKEYDNFYALFFLIITNFELDTIYYICESIKQIETLITSNIDLIKTMKKNEEILTCFENFIAMVSSANIQFNVAEDPSASDTLISIQETAKKIINMLDGDCSAIKFDFFDTSNDEYYARLIEQNENQINNDENLARQLQNE